MEHANNAASREAVITDGSILAEAYSLCVSFTAQTNILSVSMNSPSHKYIIRRQETGCENNLPASLLQHHVVAAQNSSESFPFEVHGLKQDLLLLPFFRFLYIIFSHLNTFVGKPSQLVTHSLPMVVFSSFVSFIVAGLCSVAAGVSTCHGGDGDTSTMAGSACGRIPLQENGDIYDHYEYFIRQANISFYET